MEVAPGLAEPLACCLNGLDQYRVEVFLREFQQHVRNRTLPDRSARCRSRYVRADEIEVGSVSMPVLVAPVAYQRLVDPEGEVAMARAAAAAGTPVVAVTGESKLVGLARRLQQPAVPVNADPATIATTMRSGLDGQPASLSAVHAEIARAAEGFRLLRLLLNHGITDELDSFGSLSLVPAPWTAR